jgi:hypothetical protein
LDRILAHAQPFIQEAHRLARERRIRWPSFNRESCSTGISATT